MGCEAGEAILRQRHGNLSASFVNSGSVMRAITESLAAITDAEREACGSTSAISPKCSPAMRRSINSPLISTENSPLRIRKRSLSEAPCRISVLSEGTASSQVPCEFECQILVAYEALQLKSVGEPRVSFGPLKLTQQ